MARKLKKPLVSTVKPVRKLSPLEREVITYERDLADIGHQQMWRWQRGTEAVVVAMPGDDGAPRAQRIYDGVAQLYDSNRIGADEVNAAAKWVQDYERHQRSPYVDPHTAGIRGSGGSGPELVLAAGVDASWRRDEAAQAVGPEGVALLRAFAAEGRSMRSIAREHAARTGDGTGESGAARKALECRVVQTLYALSAHYAYAARYGYRGILDPKRRPAEHTRELTQAERMPA